ncbi:hypothetical protein TruAng_011482 [Truncatella angustata]|nr:hypothetical protein TruAng_011482 [Truncatella angustata]
MARAEPVLPTAKTKSPRFWTKTCAFSRRDKNVSGCVNAIVKVLQKAGTDLYLHATEFRSFFADRLGQHVKPSSAQVAASRSTSTPLYRTQQNGAADKRVIDPKGRPLQKSKKIAAYFYAWTTPDSNHMASSPTSCED